MTDNTPAGTDDEIDGVYIHFNEEGLPCIHCFFESLFWAPGLVEAVTKGAAVELDEDDEDGEVRQFVCTMGHFANELAAIVVGNFPEAAEAMMDGFITHFKQAGALQQAAVSGPAN